LKRLGYLAQISANSSFTNLAMILPISGGKTSTLGADSVKIWISTPARSMSSIRRSTSVMGGVMVTILLSCWAMT